MLKYLIIQLDDSSTSFCHYSNDRKNRNLIPLEILKDGIFWSMKENLTLQFLYPDYEIPDDYKAIIKNTYHADIVSSDCIDTEILYNADVVVFDSFGRVNDFPFNMNQSYVFRTSFKDLLENSEALYSILPKANRINVVFIDYQELSKENEEKYEHFLDSLSQKVADEYCSGHSLQINLLTDRILLDGMNNCNAGDECITLCPDGKFYVCPAFYADIDTSYSVGNLKDGLNLKNPQLYKISHAPICRICDAYHCKRCVWLNKIKTLEINTPSREQCVLSHLERNASRKLLFKIRENREFLPDKDIVEIDYKEPFDKLILK